MMKRPRSSKANLQPATDLPWTVSRFHSCLHDASKVESDILTRCQAAGFSEHDLFAIKLAIEEALVNACKHGNKLNPAKFVKVQYRITPRRADIVIEDEGPGFNPAELPDPTAPENIERCCGRGVMLMRAYMNNVVFSPRGNKVTLTKLNEGAPQNTQAAMG